MNLLRLLFFSDDGTCKHCVALLFSLCSFCERHSDRGIESCTDRACPWDKPRKTSHPVVVQNLSYSLKPNQSDVKDKFVPVSNEQDQNNNTHVDIKDLYKACRKFGSVFVHTLDPPPGLSEDEDDDELNIETLSCLNEIISNFKEGKESVENEDILNHIRTIFTDEII